MYLKSSDQSWLLVLACSIQESWVQDAQAQAAPTQKLTLLAAHC